MALVFASYILFFTVMLFVPLGIIAIAMLPRAIKSRNYYSYALKIGFIFLMIFTVLVPNPLIWGQQIYRRLDHRQLVAPSDPAVQALNRTENLWSYILTRYGDSPEQFRMDSIPVQVERIFGYIDRLIDYEYDIDTNYVFDHVATPAEVLASGEDDCQGITCLYVSLLIYLGYNAYVCECPFHWYTRVFYDDGTGGRAYYDVWKGDTEPFYMFNEQETLFPQTLWWTINASFTFDYIPQKFFEIMSGDGGTLDLSVFGSSFPVTSIPSWVAWLVIFIICTLVGFLGSILVNIPRYKKLKPYEKIAPIFSFAIPIYIACRSILFIPLTWFLFFAIIMIGIAVFMLDAIFIMKSFITFAKKNNRFIKVKKEE